MSDKEWQALFEPRTRGAWIQKITADAKGAYSEDQLIRNLGAGVHMHAIQTRQNLEDLPHLDEASIYNSLDWKQSQGWSIGFPITLQQDTAKTLDHIRLAVSRHAESFIIEADPEAILLTENNINELLSKWPAKDTPIHFRLSPHFAHFIRSRWSHSLSVQGSIELKTLRPFSKQYPLPALPQHEEALFEEAPIFRSITSFLPHVPSESTSLLGGLLIELDTYLTRHDDKEAGLQRLLPRLLFAVQTGPNFYVEIARLRALKYLIVRFIKEYLPSFEADLDIPIIVEIQPTNLESTALSDHLLQATTMAMAAIIGGCTTLFVRPPNMASEREQSEALRLVTNLQLMLRHEAHLGQVIDPAAGSYYVEVLTHLFIESAWEYYAHER